MVYKYNLNCQILMQQEKENSTMKYGDHRVHEMVAKKYKMLRSEGILQSLEDIYVRQPSSRIEKEQYNFAFDMLKNDIEEKMITRSKLKKILEFEASKTSTIELRSFKDVKFDNEANTFTQKLTSGLPIFKSIMYLRYQDADKLNELLGEQNAFWSDQLNLDIPAIKADIGKVKFFLQDHNSLTKVNFEFRSENELQIKDDIFPYLQQIEKRADVLAKLLLYNIFSEQHRKLKQIWKNDQNYQQMLKNEKKMKSEMQPQKTKQGDLQQEQKNLKLQVRRVLNSLEERANAIAHEQFRQLNGEKAVLTKKSLEKLISKVEAETNPRVQLKILIAYKQKKSW